MMMRFAPLLSVVLTVVLLALPALAGELIPKAELVPLNSTEGLARLDRIQAQTDHALLGAVVETQSTQTFAGVATAVSILNALPVARPVDDLYEPYPFFTQRSFFSDAMAHVVTRNETLKVGMTLEQLAGAIRWHGAEVVVIFAGKGTAQQFREMITEAMTDRELMIAVNYRRDALGQPGGGHFSPIGGYDAETDSVLILDVARYRYPPIWVKIDDLMTAMRKVDSDSGKTRGWLIVSAD